jgi:hypothetical protein
VIRKIVKEDVNKSNYPMQNLLVLVMQTHNTWYFDVRSGTDWIDEIIGFEIALCSYVTTLCKWNK